MILWKGFAFLSIVLSGCDFRFGWSRAFPGPVPWWLALLALFLVLGGHILIFLVLKANRFAASIIQVEAGQAVIDTGPYRFVRHPMYSAIAAVWLCTPLALGSFVAIPAGALISSPSLFSACSTRKKCCAASCPAMSNIVSAPATGSSPVSGRAETVSRQTLDAIYRSCPDVVVNSFESARLALYPAVTES
jgi:hypothetical protein